MDQRVFVRELPQLDGETLALLLERHPYDDYRRHRRIDPDKAHQHLVERVTKAAAREGTVRLVALERQTGRPAGLMLVQRIPEDSELLGLAMAGLPFLLARPDHPAPRRIYRALLDSLPFVVQREGLDHVSARIDTSDIAAYQELTDAGFRLVETLLSMAYDTERRGTGTIDPAAYGFDGIVRKVEPSDVDAISQLASTSFTLNRYHLDEDIPKRDAGELMARWARSYCLDRANCDVWVAEAAGGKLAGFLGAQINRDLERWSGITVSGRALLAVSDQRGRVGQMLSRAHTWMSRGDYKEADTQLNNYGMIKAAFNLDMDLVRTKYTFHRSFLR